MLIALKFVQNYSFNALKANYNYLKASFSAYKAKN
jgi:hypothetical protein